MLSILYLQQCLTSSRHKRGKERVHAAGVPKTFWSLPRSIWTWVPGKFKDGPNTLLRLCRQRTQPLQSTKISTRARLHGLCWPNFSQLFFFFFFVRRICGEWAPRPALREPHLQFPYITPSSSLCSVPGGWHEVGGSRTCLGQPHHNGAVRSGDT